MLRTNVTWVCGFLVAACCMLSPAVSAAATLLSENFDSLTLGPSVDEQVAANNVWTKTAPAGWTIDDSGIPGVGTELDGVTEWAGWSFADKDWWVQTAEDQNRSQFANASGTVAVADPDEWDDSDHADSEANGWYDTFMTTAPISLEGMQANTATLAFDSSWRPEFDGNYHQTANITVSYDGAAPVQVMLWESDSNSPNFKPDTTNENVSLALDNPPGASNMTISFGLFDAGNDWWWAVDNVEVAAQAVPEPSTALLAAFGFIGLMVLGAWRKRP